jgi:hypothetical protein
MDLGPPGRQQLLHHAAWNVGCWQFPFANDLGADFLDRVDVAKARSCDRKPILETPSQELRAPISVLYVGLWDFLIFPGPRNPVPAILIGGGVPVWAKRSCKYGSPGSISRRRGFN